MNGAELAALRSVLEGIVELRRGTALLLAVAGRLVESCDAAVHPKASDVRDDLKKIHQACSNLDGLVAAPGDLLRHKTLDPAASIGFLRHELRTPLNIVKGYADMVVEDAASLRLDALHPILQELVSAADALLTDIDQLLNVSVPKRSGLPSSVDHLRTDAVIASAGRTSSNGAAHVLIVDDAPENLDVLTRRLERLGHRVTAVASGEAALEVLRSAAFDLVMLDLMMPGLDGHEVLSIIKSDPQLTEVPVVMISALNEVGSVVRCIDAGAEDYLNKPFEPTLLRARVNACLERKRLRDIEREHASFLKAQADFHARELEAAQRIQMAILPSQQLSEPPGHPEGIALPQATQDIELFATMLPARDVGGDFFDHFWLDQHRLGVVIADVSGKGMAAALFMSLALTMLRATAPSYRDPAECMAKVNRQLCRDNVAMMFVTLFYGIYDTRTHELRYANAGHDQPYMVFADGAIAPLDAQLDSAIPGNRCKSNVARKAADIVLGVMETASYRTRHVLLQPGSAVFMLTDGITEAMNEDMIEFHDVGVQNVLQRCRNASAAEMIAQIVDAVRSHAGNAPQSDDITCLVLKRNLA